MDILFTVRDIKKNFSLKKRIFKEALKGISFDVYEGEIFTLLGVNGAGKTTLSSIIASLITKSSGDIIFKGRSIYEDIISYRRMIGFCSQHDNLDNYMNLEENLIFAGRYYLLSRGEIRERIDYLMEKFELSEYRYREVIELSGGYRKRFMLARTMMHRPKLVILDEPTVGLDPDMRRKLWKYILELKNEKVSVVLTTHYLDEADILSDRVCILDSGRVKAIDSPPELKKRRKESSLEEIFLKIIKEETE